MPLLSVKSSKSDNLKKTPMNYQVPNTKNYLYGSLSKMQNVAPDRTINSSDAKTSKRKSNKTQVEYVKKPLQIRSSRSESFEFSAETDSSTEETWRFSDMPSCENNGFNKDFDIGEPSKFQHLTIDFTPIKGVDDNEKLQQKCIDFWDFVETQPMLQKIMAVPVKIKSYDQIDDEINNVENVNDQNIQHISQKGMAMDWTDELRLNCLGKLSYKYCPEPLSSQKTSKSELKLPKSSTWTMKHKKTMAKEVIKSASSRAKEETKKVCAEMEEFDRKHPRTFDPPVDSSPTLITAKMQRYLPSLTCAPLSTD